MVMTLFETGKDTVPISINPFRDVSPHVKDTQKTYTTL